MFWPADAPFARLQACTPKVANPETVMECSKTPAFRESVVNLCIAAVCQKYKVELDQRLNHMHTFAHM